MFIVSAAAEGCEDERAEGEFAQDMIVLKLQFDLAATR